MGGRGASSGVASTRNATGEQKRIMSNIKRAVEKRTGTTPPKFTRGTDGVVHYSYTETKIVSVAHAGKMQSEEKNDIYERTIHHTGRILTDGLIRQNKSKIKDVLKRKGRAR